MSHKESILVLGAFTLICGLGLLTFAACDDPPLDLGEPGEAGDGGAEGEGGTGGGGGEGGTAGMGGEGGEGELCQEWLDDWPPGIPSDEMECVDNCCSDWLRAPDCDENGENCICPPGTFDVRECKEGDCKCPYPKARGEVCDQEEGWLCQPTLEDYEECPARMCGTCSGFGEVQTVAGCKCACFYHLWDNICLEEGLGIKCSRIDDP